MLAEIQAIYTKFLDFFPVFFHPCISLILGIVLVISIFQVLKKNLVWLIVLIILLPASIPILKGVLQGLLKLLKFLFGVS